MFTAVIFAVSFISDIGPEFGEFSEFGEFVR
jgi:hypothetical protein